MGRTMYSFKEQFSSSKTRKKKTFKSRESDSYKGFVSGIDKELDKISKELGMSPLNALRAYSKKLRRLKELEEQVEQVLELTKTDNITNANRVIKSFVRAKEGPEWLCVPASVWGETVPNPEARKQLFYEIRNLVKKIGELQIHVDYEHLKEMYFGSQAEAIISYCQTLIENHYTQRKEDMRMQEALEAEIEKVISKFPMPPSVVEEMRSVVKEVGEEYGEAGYYFAELKEKVAYVLEEGLSRYAERDYPDFFAEKLKNLVESLPNEDREKVPAYIMDMVKSEKQKQLK